MGLCVCLHMLVCEEKWKTRMMLEVNKLEIMFGNMASFMSDVDYDSKKLPARGRELNATPYLLSQQVGWLALNSSICQWIIFPQAFQRVPECSSRHCQSWHTISYSVNVFPT